MKRKFIAPLIVAAVLIVATAGLVSAMSSLSGYFKPGGPSLPGGIGLPVPNPLASPSPRTPSGSEDSGSCTFNTTLSAQAADGPHTPLFEVTGAASTSYLRSVAMSTYQGGTWQVDERASYRAYDGSPLSRNLTGYSSTQQDNIAVTPLKGFSPGFIPTALYTSRLSLGLPLQYYADDEAFYSPQTFSTPYTFTTVQYSFNEATLRGAAVLDDKRYLQLPAEITPRTRDLANKLVEGRTNAYDKAKAIEAYLRSNSNYKYDLAYTPAPAGREANDWFLFDEKRGVCVNFNSALVVLARAAGIPARLVGGFAIAVTSERQVVYGDQRHAWSEVGFKSLGWVTFDATAAGSGPRRSQGQGSTPTPAPAPPATTTPTPKPSPTPTVTPVAKIATQTTIDAMDDSARKGNTFKVQGRVLAADGTMPDNMTVQVFLNKVKDKSGTLVGEGRTQGGEFIIDGTVPSGIEVGDYQVMAQSLGDERYQGSWSDPQIRITASTNLTLALPETARLGQEVTIEGKLAEEHGAPVAGQRIQVSLEDGRPLGEVSTDQDGAFSLKHSFASQGRYQVNATFGGSDYYLWSKSAARVEVLDSGLQASVPAAGGFPWLYLTLIPLLAGLGGSGLWYYLRRHSHQPPSATESSPAQSAAPPQAVATSLSIAFPQIEGTFPDVWGLGEALEIRVSMVGEGLPLPGRAVSLSANGEHLCGMSLDSSRQGSIFHTFSSKGSYAVAARFRGDGALAPSVSPRVVRIVDYREEMVALFNELVSWFKGRGADIGVETTPRELQAKLLDRFSTIDQKALDTVIYCFEEANYSLHPIARSNYKAMFRAQQRVRESVGGQGEAQ